MKSYSDIAIALAGICQSTALIPMLAQQGRCNKDRYHISIKSLFILSPRSTLDVYGNITNIRSGLVTLNTLLHSGKDNCQLDVIRYILGSLAVADKLRHNKEAQQKLLARLARIEITHNWQDLNHSPEQEDALSYTLAGAYSDIISPLTTKIRVKGRPECLQNNLTQARVRTALFAAVRAAILWHQVGGNRWQFLFNRRRLLQATQLLSVSS